MTLEIRCLFVPNFVPSAFFLPASWTPGAGQDMITYHLGPVNLEES